MAARPSSPTSLLWAHQLKREHGHLLKRMQELEASSERQNKRIKTAETAAKSGASADLATLAKQVKALEDGGVGRRLSKLENDIRNKTEELDAGSKAITMQVTAMQRDAEALDEEKRTAFAKEKALLKRIAELETGLKSYEQAMVQVGRRIDETRLEQIKAQLEGLSQQVAKEGSQMKKFAESVTVLEVANEELKKSNQFLSTELEKVAARAAAPSGAAAGGEQDETQDLSSNDDVAPRNLKKGKRHGWTGGGSDRDIIASGTQMFPETAAAASRKESEPADDEHDVAVSKKPRPPPRRQKYKPIPPHLRPATPKDQANPKKSHRWGGGGADKDILRAGRGGNQVLDGGATQDIVRSGRGWYEVAVSPGAEDEQPTSAAPRPALQPRKRIITPRWTVEDAMTQGRVTRKRGQDAIKEEDEAEQPPSKRVAKPSTKSKNAASKPAPRGKATDSSRVVASTPQAQAAPARRRRIVQDD